MAVKDYTRTVAPALVALLAGGERLLAASPLVQDPGTVEDVSVRDELVNLLDPGLLIGLSHPGNAAQQAVFGRAVIGGPGSAGRRLHEAIGKVTGPKVAVTDRRLLIVELDAVPRSTSAWGRWFGPADQIAQGRYEVDRPVILGAVAAPAGALRRGRLLVGFQDGSGCMLVCAPPSLAPPVVDAIGAPER
jgi:hypothetical protein